MIRHSGPCSSWSVAVPVMGIAHMGMGVPKLLVLMLVGMPEGAIARQPS